MSDEYDLRVVDVNGRALAWSDPAGPAGRRQWRELLASYTMNPGTGLYVGWADGDQETGRGGTSLFAKVSHGFAF